MLCRKIITNWPFVDKIGIRRREDDDDDGRKKIFSITTLTISFFLSCRLSSTTGIERNVFWAVDSTSTLGIYKVDMTFE